MKNKCPFVMIALLPCTVLAGCSMQRHKFFHLNSNKKLGSIENTNREKCLQFCLLGSLCVWVWFDDETKVCTWYRELPSSRTYEVGTSKRAYEKMCVGTPPTIEEFQPFIMTEMPYQADLISNSSQKSESFCAYTCFRNKVCDAYVYQDTDKQCLMYKMNPSGMSSCVKSMNCFIKL